MQNRDTELEVLTAVNVVLTTWNTVKTMHFPEISVKNYHTILRHSSEDF
jgi:hypothetical protein